MRIRRGAVTTVVAVATAGVVPVVAAVPAAAAGCSRVMSVDYRVPSNAGIVLTPSKVTVRGGDCVGFTNNTVPSATVTVAGGYHVTLGYGESTTAKSSYHAGPAGSFAVTATNGPAVAHGSITVTATPTQSHSPSPTPTSASPRPTSSSSSASGPRVAPTPSARTSTSPAALPTPSPLPSSTSVVVPPPATPTVAPSPSTSPLAVVAGPVQPPTDRGLGLPAALAALAVVGVATALLRVLLAHTPSAVDNRGTVGPAA